MVTSLWGWPNYTIVTLGNSIAILSAVQYYNYPQTAVKSEVLYLLKNNFILRSAPQIIALKGITVQYS